jgi:very-short-patch-repair endonuclease
LRDRRLASAKFRRQHQVGPYVLDFYCREYRLAIEADGGQHLSDEGMRADAERAQYLAARRIRCIRFTNLEALRESEAVIEAIYQALGSPSP